MKVVRLGTTTSTNDEARRLAKDGAAHGTAVVADVQTAGRGRRGRVWASPKGNLFVSIVLRPRIAPADAPPLAPAMGLAVAEAIEDVAPLAAKLKWPNDVLVGGRKVAGVLTESLVAGAKLEAVIVGIGVNVGAELPPELAEIATTLSREAVRNVRKQEVEDALLAAVVRMCERVAGGGFAAIADDWTARDARRGTKVRIDAGGRVVEGVAAGIAPDGGYRVTTASGETVAVTAGEVL